MSLPLKAQQAAARRHVPAEYRFHPCYGGESASVMVSAQSRHVGICSIDLLPSLGHGWLSRLKIGDQDRGRGVGEELLWRALNWAGQLEFRLVIVEPGGYGSSLPALRRWYLMQGFVRYDDSESCLTIRLDH